MPILESFFGDSGARQFIENCWPDTAYIQDGDVPRLGAIGMVAEFNDVELLLSNLPGQVDLVYKDGRRVLVPKPLDALDVYRAGAAMLYLKDLEVFPAVAGACDELARLFSIPRHHVSCEGFAATGEVHVPAHFDHETNFMIQIRGEKTWTFARNTSLPDPTFPYFPSNPDRFYDQGKDPFSGEPLPRAMPEPHQVRVVGPGTVTFMPRGYWHSTRTHEESFAIGFVINPPTLAEIATAAILAKLHASAVYRAHPLLAHTPQGRGQLVRLLDEVLAQVGSCSSELSASRLLDTYMSAPAGNSRPLHHPK